MSNLFFSFVIPVFNRPDEVEELLQSLSLQTYQKPFEVVLVEDGSTQNAKQVVAEFKDKLQISYYYKENSGPGDSRNYGMQRAQGNYFIILDSDCIVPPHYLVEVERELNNQFVHCFGGPDNAHESFSNVQKGINYAMTSFLTTGGIRGGKKSVDKFQPRSFNLGISKEAFEVTKGFGNIHPGEDPDLTFRIWENGYQTRLLPKAYVYHKRRIDWGKFYKQVNKFGSVRPILNHWHPKTKKLTYWFPSVFILGFIAGLGLLFLGYPQLLIFYGIYFLILLIDALIRSKSLKIAFLSLYAVCIQFTGYGIGFLKSTILLNFNHKPAEDLFPKLFFSKK